MDILRGHGITLDQLGPLIEASLKAYGVRRFSVEVTHTEDVSESTKMKLHRNLVENERSSKNFMIINFLQGIFTGDAMIGHIAPIGAYDPGRRHVLVMDPDRQWYEPYWVSEETLLKGLATLNKESGRSRGYIQVKIEE